MNWIPDSNWLKVIDEIRAGSWIAIFIASVAIYVAAESNLFYLGVLPAWLRAVCVATAVLALLFASVRLVEWGSAAVVRYQKLRSDTLDRQRQQEEGKAQLREKEQEILGDLNTLNENERKLLTYLVEHNQQSFPTALTNAAAGTLRQKGILIIASGGHSTLDWPHMVPNFVWAELMRRRDEFIRPKERRLR